MQVLVQSWPPHLALSPLAQCDPPLMPFRDAGYSQADFVLNVQDVVYGVWKAKEKGIVNLREFGLDEYVSSFSSSADHLLTPQADTRNLNGWTWATSIGSRPTSSPSRPRSMRCRHHTRSSQCYPRRTTRSSPPRCPHLSATSSSTSTPETSASSSVSIRTSIPPNTSPPSASPTLT